MKLEILQENLSYGLNLASRVLSSKPQLTILSHLLLETIDGGLTITASNQETTIVAKIGAKVISPGQFTLPGRTFVEIVSSLSAEKLSLELTGSTLSLQSGSFKATINGTPATEFPSLVPSSLPENPTWELDHTLLQAIIFKTVFAAATDESRAVLTGVLFKPTESGLTLAATDGFRLSTLKLDKFGNYSKTQDPLTLNIPAKTLLEVARFLGDLKSTKSDKEKTHKVEVSILEERSQILFNFGDVKIFSRLIAGNFPDFEKIIPASSSLKLTLEASELSSAIRLASIFARESANIVKLRTENGKLKISANAPQVGENESEVDAKIDGKEDIAIAFNFRYILDLLASVPEGELEIELSGPTAPGVFRFPSDPSFLHLIMPVRVQN